MARRRRRVRKARANPRRRRRVSRRRLRANPRRRRSRRRLRRNPGSGVFARAEGFPLVAATKPKRRRRRKGRKLSAKARRRRASAGRLAKRGRSIRKRAKGMKRGIRKSVALTQARRYSTLARVVRRGGKAGRSPVYKAMHIKTNPGIAGIVVAAKALAPQAAVGGVAMFGLAFGGKFIASKVVAHLPAAIQPYAPALGTIVATGVAYVVADKVAPKYKGAVAIGGLLGAIVQGVVAAASASPGGFVEKAKAALLGDYTTVGGRAYADGGMFREVGDYTTVGGGSESRDGGAYSNQRPRRSERDNATQWALSGGSESRDGGAYSNQRPRRSERDNATEWATNGLDDNTEFAPGEGGVLSGGLFRGSSR